MGFTWDTPITTDADLEVAEQSLSKLLRDGATRVALHKDVANAIYREIKALGYDPAKIVTRYFEKEARLAGLVEIFTAQARDGNAKAQLKAQLYTDQYLREKAENRKGLPQFIETVDADTVTKRSGPRVMNHEGGSFYAPGLPRYSGSQTGKHTVTSFDDYVKDAPA